MAEDLAWNAVFWLTTFWFPLAIAAYWLRVGPFKAIEPAICTGSADGLDTETTLERQIH